MSRPGDLVGVLIVDDDRGAREALSALMEGEEGLELAAAASDAAEAIALAEREQPDVAIIDVRIPGGGCVAAARGIARRRCRSQWSWATSSRATRSKASSGRSGAPRRVEAARRCPRLDNLRIETGLRLAAPAQPDLVEELRLQFALPDDRVGAAVLDVAR